MRKVFANSRGWWLVVAALASSTVALAAVALAADDKGKKPAKKSEGRSLSFEDDAIETQYQRPDTDAIQGLSNRTRNSLIRIRKDFFAEIIRSAEDI